MNNTTYRFPAVLMIMLMIACFFQPWQLSAEDDLTVAPPPEIVAIDNPAIAPTAPPSPSPDPQEANVADTTMSLFDLINKGGIVGYLIILLSVVALGLILDYLVTIRKSKILPPDDIRKIEELIKNGNLKEAGALDNGDSSYLMKVAVAGLKDAHLGYPVMIKAMEDEGDALSSGIARKIEHLNVIGNISPMMGLLGTVIGMLRCFNEIAHVAGAIEPKQLAGGIFEALVTTCMGLIVAIPALYAYAVFKNRVDEYTGEASLTAEQLVSSFKSG